MKVVYNIKEATFQYKHFLQKITNMLRLHIPLSRAEDYFEICELLICE